MVFGSAKALLILFLKETFLVIINSNGSQKFQENIAMYSYDSIWRNVAFTKVLTLQVNLNGPRKRLLKIVWTLALNLLMTIVAKWSIPTFGSTAS